MKCNECGRPATFHMTKIVYGEKRELHLCDECVRKLDLIPEGVTPQLNVGALVQILSGLTKVEDHAGLTCATCGLKYAAFRADGRLGCPDDYDAFRPALEQLLDRIHRAVKHVGKTPRAALNRAEITHLQEKLREAIKSENYEEAAGIRDLLRQKEASDEPR